MMEPIAEGSERQEMRSAGQIDHEDIRRGLEDAEREDRPIDDATARRIAVQLHGGQDSPLLSLASCGAIREGRDDETDMGLGVRSLADELAECRRFFGEEIEPWIQAVENYAASRDDKGPVENWAELTTGQELPRAEVRTAEPARITTPRIYVASLADYNNGTLHGRWIDADRDPDEIRAEIAAMLAESNEDVAEDWAIHDYEGFGAFQVGEYESLDAISAVALGIAECGQAFAAYASWAGTSEEALHAFNDCYLGFWSSTEAWARDTADDFGWEAALRQLPEDMQPYVSIDYQQLVQFMESVMTVVECGGGIYVFAER